MNCFGSKGADSEDPPPESLLQLWEIKPSPLDPSPQNQLNCDVTSTSSGICHQLSESNLGPYLLCAEAGSPEKCTSECQPALAAGGCLVMIVGRRAAVVIDRTIGGLIVLVVVRLHGPLLHFTMSPLLRPPPRVALDQVRAA